jgi:type IV pilus assembly protein PilB
MLMELNLRAGKLYFGRGCQRCNNSGHRGRLGIFELLVVNDEIRNIVSAGASTDQLRQACCRLGMTTLRESGLHALFGGMTTIEEVARETAWEGEG